MHGGDSLDADRRMTAEKVEKLLGVLCVKFGFCLHASQYDELCDSPPGSPREFLDAVLRAEGYSPETADPQTFRAMLNEVQMAFEGCRQ